MQNRFFLIPIAIVSVVLAIYITLQFLQSGFGNLISMLTLAAVLIPVVIIIANEAYSSWGGLVLVAVCLNANLSIPLLDRFTFTVATSILIFCMMLARKSLSKINSGFIFADAESRLVFAATVIIIFRILADPPNSARLGGTGGLAEALYYSLCGCIFWALSIYTFHKYDVKKQFPSTIRWLLAATGLFFIMRIVWLVKYGTMGALFQPAIFITSAFLLAWLYHWESQGHNRVKFRLIRYWLISVTIGIALMSAGRTFLPIAMSIVLIAAYAYSNLRRVLLVLCCIIIPFILLVVMSKPELMPTGTFRSLSLIMPETALRFQREFAPDAAKGEFGWKENEFRRTMYRSAWERIQEKPFIGRGFAFSFSDIVMSISALNISGDVAGGLSKALMVSGGFHNSMLSLAYFCGLPAALCYSLAVLLIYWKVLSSLRRMPHNLDKAMTVALLGSLTGALLNALTQGSGLEWITVSIMLGLLHGTYRRILFANLDAKRI